MDFNPKNHEHLFKTIAHACQAGGLNIAHPIVQKAMADTHMKIYGMMPHSTDAERAAEVSKRAPALVNQVKRAIPVEHLAAGGLAEMPGNLNQQPVQQPVQQQPTRMGTTDLACGGMAKGYAKGTTDGPVGEDDEVPTDPDEMAGAATGQPQDKYDPTIVPRTGKFVMEHPGTAATMLATAPLAVAQPEVGVPLEEAELAGAGGATAAEAAESAAPGLASKVLSGAGNAAKAAGKGLWGVTKYAAAPLVAAYEGTQLALHNNVNQPPGPAQTALSATVAPAVAAASDKLNGIPKGPNDSTSRVPVAPTTPAAPLPTTPQDAKVASGNNPEARQEQPQVDVTASPLPNQLNNSNAMVNQATTPVQGQIAALQANQDRTQEYANEQTPEAMAAAQRDKGAVLGAGLAASLTPFGGGGANTQSAINSLANLGQNNLENQQKYGANASHLANVTSTDVANTQGQAIQNGLAGAAAPRAAAANVNTLNTQQGQDITDFHTIKGAINQLSAGGGTLANDSIQALLAGNTPAQVFSNMQGLNAQQKAAINTIYQTLHNGQHNDLLDPKTGVVDANSLMTAMNTKLAKETVGVQGAKGNLAIQEGAMNSGDVMNQQPVVAPENKAQGGIVGTTETRTVDKARSIYHHFVSQGRNVVIDEMTKAGINPATASTYYANFIKGFADGGVVEDDSDDDSDVDDSEMPMDTHSILQRALGIKPKQMQVTKDETNPIQDEHGNTVGAEREIDAQSPVEVAAVKTDNPETTGDVPASSQDEQPEDDIPSMVAEEAKRQGVDPRLAHAIMMTESQGNPKAINTNRNGSVDYGPMQVNSTNYAKGEDTGDVALNIHKGVAYLKQCVNVAGGDPQTAAYCYNNGANARFTPQLVKNDHYANTVMKNMQI